MEFLSIPDEMSPDERFAEVVAILAAGCARLMKRGGEPELVPDPRPLLTESRLDSGPEPRASLVADPRAADQEVTDE